MAIVTPTHRVSFAQVFQPRAFQEGQDKKYSTVMLFPKSQDLSEMKRIHDEAIAKKWGSKVPKNLRIPFRDGDESELDGYAGHIFVRAATTVKPQVVEADGETEIVDQSDFYSGCYAKASVTAYAYDVSGNRGVSFELHNVQKVAEGEPFSGRRKAADEFEPVTDDIANATVATSDLL